MLFRTSTRYQQCNKNRLPWLKLAKLWRKKWQASPEQDRLIFKFKSSVCLITILFYISVGAFLHCRCYNRFHLFLISNTGHTAIFNVHITVDKSVSIRSLFSPAILLWLGANPISKTLKIPMIFWRFRRQRLFLFYYYSSFFLNCLLNSTGASESNAEMMTIAIDWNVITSPVVVNLCTSTPAVM